MIILKNIALKGNHHYSASKRKLGEVDEHDTLYYPNITKEAKKTIWY
jgi:hypothetical protein